MIEDHESFFRWQDELYRSSYREVGNNTSLALRGFEDIFQVCSQAGSADLLSSAQRTVPHYLIYEGVLSALESDCPNPTWRRYEVQHLRDTYPSLTSLMRAYCGKRAYGELREASSVDLRELAEPYAMAAADLQETFSFKTGAVFPDSADSIAEDPLTQRLLRIAQLKLECEYGQLEANELFRIDPALLDAALDEAELVDSIFVRGDIPSVRFVLFGEEGLSSPKSYTESTTVQPLGDTSPALAQRA